MISPRSARPAAPGGSVDGSAPSRRVAASVERYMVTGPLPGATSSVWSVNEGALTKFTSPGLACSQPTIATAAAVLKRGWFWNERNGTVGGRPGALGSVTITSLPVIASREASAVVSPVSAPP